MIPSARIRPRLALAALCALAALSTAMAAPARADAARIRCAGTFRVLHDDHVGRLTLPRGRYRITILAGGSPSCGAASALLTRFLEDYDGRLPGGWRVGASSRVFIRRPGVGFHVAPVRRNEEEGGEEESGGGGRHPTAGMFCPDTFRVLHRDHVGGLKLSAGPYWIVMLQRRGLACSEASRLFAGFLDDTSGRLPPPWILETQTASFRRSASGVGFRVKPAR